MRALSRVVLPLPVPPETRTLRRAARVERTSSSIPGESEPSWTRVLGRDSARAESANGDGDVGGCGCNANGNARRVVIPVDVPRSGSLDEWVRFAVHLPAGHGPAGLPPRPILRRRTRRPPRGLR